MFDASVTLFSIPAPFEGQTNLMQRRAIASWRRHVGADVMLFGDEPGLAETAREFGSAHYATLRRNDLGTPLVTDAFSQARARARTRNLAYVNTDIILMSDFALAVGTLTRSPLRDWLMVGQRYDIDVHEPFSLDEPDLRRAIRSNGRLHGRSGIDYFAFPRHLSLTMPDMAVGRPGWDSWLIYSARAAGIPVVDATHAVLAIHQNHPPRYRSGDAEAAATLNAAGGYFRMGTIRDADWALQPGRDEPTLTNRLSGRIWFSAPVRAALAVKRRLLG